MRLRVKIRQNRIVTTAFFAVVSAALIFWFQVTNKPDAIAAASGDYRTIASGNWNGAAVWEKYNGSSWSPTATPPNSTNNVITIQSGHTVTVTANVTVDQVVVNSGGAVNLNSSVTLTIANGSGTDYNISGTFTSAGTVTINASATIVFNSGGLYQHNFTTSAGTIPAATWSSGSTCSIVGYTSCITAPSGLQSFSNFTWNCPSQSGTINLSGGLTTVGGNFTVGSTGSGEFVLSGNGSNLSIGGNFSQSGGTFKLSTGNNQTSNVDITGDMTLSGGTFNVVMGSASIANINVYGDYTHSAGTLTEGGSSTANGQINFKGTGTQTFVSGGTVSQSIDFTVFSGSVLDMGTYVCGGRYFDVNSGGGLKLGSAAGITTSGSTGNVQCSSTRTFSTSGDYTYTGSSAQVTGNALPSTVHNLTISNSSNVTLSGNVTASNLLTFTAGRLITSSYEMNVTNTSTSSITGNSNTCYVVGNLRRSVGTSGTYAFPLGTTSYSELLRITLSSITGVSNILGTFVNTNPVVAGYPLSGLTVNGVGINKMLDYGYWTLSPNAALSGGTYTVEVNEQGFSNSNSGSGCTYCVLERNNTSSSWQSTGTHDEGTQFVNNGIVTAVRSVLNNFYQYGIGYVSILSFTSPSLTSGTNGQPNAIYLFEDVCSNVDAWIQIISLDGGATLNSIDITSSGYNEAFQPYINLAANSTSSILWKIIFKVANTSTDTILPNVTMTGIDVDGQSNLREFIEATMPNSYSVSNTTSLTITNTDGNYRATASTTDLNGIDTATYDASYQLNYVNVNSMYYRTGGVSTSGSVITRQTSLYFKAFLSGNISLPIELIYFNAKLKDDKVDLKWATASEINNQYFTVERSEDGENFEELFQLEGAGNSTMRREYSRVDEKPLSGTSYYRLKQTDFDGKFTYSDIESVNRNKSINPGIEIQSIGPNPFNSELNISFTSSSAKDVDIILINANGKLVDQKVRKASGGLNRFLIADIGNLSPGIYFVILSDGENKVTRKVLKN